jgi:alkylation response protein AidB-like acyl-CoA dehydrogenase
MDFKLTKPQKEIQKAAWEFARGEFDKEVIIELSKEQKIPGHIIAKAGELGFIGIHFPEAFGGGGMGALEYTLVAETFCRKDSTLGTALMFSAYGTECLLRSGDNTLKNKFLPDILDGKLTSTAAFLEPGQGSDLSKIATRAEKDGENWIITGQKVLVPAAATAGIYVVLCRTDADATDGTSLFLVEKKHKGVSIGNPRQSMGGRMLPLADISFDHVTVPADHLIGKPGSGFLLARQFFMENRIQIAAQAVGTAQGAFDRALDYVRQRQQFGKKLAQFQVTRHKLADMASKIAAARYLTYYAAWCFDQKTIEPYLAAMAKMTAARAALEVSDEAVQLLGGYGYMTEYEVEHFYRDAKMAEIFQGPPAVQKDVIADGIIGKLK